jgi:cyclopropane fatty-acyl-phospholipid synthase-like methyltransferase
MAGFPALPQEESLAPYVPSPQVVVDKMLEAADLKAGETVYDLGCGDGRIVITAAEKFKAKGVGVELSPKLVREAKDQVEQRGLQDRITIIHGNLLDVDVTPADVVTLYLLTTSNERLKPVFEKCLRRGARVVSHDFVMRGWKPARVEKVHANNRTHTIYVYEMPPKKD